MSGMNIVCTKVVSNYQNKELASAKPMLKCWLSSSRSLWLRNSSKKACNDSLLLIDFIEHVHYITHIYYCYVILIQTSNATNYIITATLGAVSCSFQFIDFWHSHSIFYITLLLLTQAFTVLCAETIQPTCNAVAVPSVMKYKSCNCNLESSGQKKLIS